MPANPEARDLNRKMMNKALIIFVSGCVSGKMPETV